MSFWNKIETEKDIEILMDNYCGFHDSCIVSVLYESGTFVDPEGAMHFSDANGHRMRVIFQSQIEKKKLELLFIGLRQVHLVAWQDNYTCDIYDAHISIQKELLPGEAKRQVVWADYSRFDINDIDNVISEPANSYIVSNELRWRLI
ncbi:MAG: hypothetical protein ACOX1F_01630 [Erysipelotrichaceae bacterium]